MGCHTYESEKKSSENPEKIWVDFAGKILQGRFYRAPKGFKIVTR